MKIEKGKRKKTVKDQIVILLTERNDMTRQSLSDALQKSQGVIDASLCSLRKLGYRIWPSKGAGTPLRIARTQTDATKFINWRRSRFLETAKRMVIAELELGEQYQELSAAPKELLESINNAPYELPERANPKVKARSKSA